MSPCTVDYLQLMRHPARPLRRHPAVAWIASRRSGRFELWASADQFRIVHVWDEWIDAFW